MLHAADGLGAESLGVTCAAVSIAVFLAPWVVAHLGHKWAMLIGSLGYVAFMSAVISIVPGVVLAVSFVFGLALGLLWVAFGSYLICASDPRHYGRNSSIFWAIYQCSSIAGNGLAYLTFKRFGNQMLFVCFTAVSGLGALGFCLVKPVRNDTTLARSPLTHARQTLSVLITAPMLYLFAMITFTGMEFSFYTGSFPLLLRDGDIPLVMTLCGVGELVGGGLLGWASDRIGRRRCVLISTVVFGGALGLCCYIKVFHVDMICRIR